VTPSLGGSVGVGPEVVAIATSARQDLDPGLRAWVASRPRPWAVAAELAAAHRVDDHPGLYRYNTWVVASSLLGEWAFGTHATAVRFGLGPALVLRDVRVTSADERAETLLPELGARARMALDGPFSPGLAPLGWQVRVGATARSAGVDWDAGAGLGVRW
jgi:hypothetical protein